MFTSSDPNLPDLDFELVDEQQHHQQPQNTFLNESMLKDLLSSGTSTYRIVNQPTTTTTPGKRPGTNPLLRQLTDESPNKQRTPPNSTGTSLSPLSSAFFTRLSTSHENHPIRITNASNTIRVSSSATNNGSPTSKTLDAVTLLLKQTTASNPFIQTLPTRLENPTKYHLEQISRKQTLVDDDDCVISMSAPTTTMLSPPVQQDESSPDSEITSEMDDQLNDDTTCGSVDSNTRGITITPRLSMTLTGDPLSSAYLSSSLSKDNLDSSSRHSSSCPTNILSAKAKIGLPLTDDEMRLVLRDRQKKDNHNMIERRRRFNINDRIKELGTLLPKGTELDLKQNKGTILRASVDYIKILRRQYDNVTLVGEKCQLLADQNAALQERVKDLERKCLSNGIPIQPSSTSLINKGSPAIAVLNSNQVKQEPSSLSSSLNTNPNPLVPPSTPIFAGFDTFPPLDSPSAFGLVDDDSNDTSSAAGGNNPSASRDPLSPLGHDPFLSSTSFGFDNEMDIGGGFT